MNPFDDLYAEMAGAARDKRAVTVSYTGRDGNRREREVVPVRFENGRWMVYDLTADGPRWVSMFSLESVTPVLGSAPVATAVAPSLSDLSLEDQVLALGRFEVQVSSEGVTLTWGRTANGVHTTVTKPTLAEALAAATAN